jgi:hypothetical protein
MEEWRNELWFNHTIENPAAIKNDDLLPPATKWMTLHDIMMNRRRQTQYTQCGSTLHEFQGQAK